MHQEYKEKDLLSVAGKDFRDKLFREKYIKDLEKRLEMKSGFEAELILTKKVKDQARDLKQMHSAIKEREEEIEDCHAGYDEVKLELQLKDQKIIALKELLTEGIPKEATVIKSYSLKNQVILVLIYAITLSSVIYFAG